DSPSTVHGSRPVHRPSRVWHLRGFVSARLTRMLGVDLYPKVAAGDRSARVLGRARRRHHLSGARLDGRGRGESQQRSRRDPAFVVHQADGDTFRGLLDDAAAFTTAAPGTRALVTFDRGVFQGADHPQTILLQSTPGPKLAMYARTTSIAPTAGRSATASRRTGSSGGRTA